MLQAYSKAKSATKPLRYLWILLHLILLRVKRLIASELRKPELFILKLVFAYYLWLTYLYCEPHIVDLRNLDMSWTDQAELWLSNAGFTSPPIEDLRDLSGYHIVMAGMVKDAEKTLPTLMAQLETLACAFASAHIIILESNSDDHTRDIIREWQRNPPDCEEVHDALLHSLPNRMKNRLRHLHEERRRNASANADDHELFGNHRIFEKGGRVSIEPIQPSREFEEISHLMQKHETEGYGQVREERYVIYRNFLLDRVAAHYKQQKEETGVEIDYLFWVDMDLRGIDIQAIANEFSYAWRAGFDVVCSNGIKYTGWYYDSYATVYEDGEWAYGQERWRITNRIRGERFYEMKSCFGGFAAYSLPFLLETGCRYQHFGWAHGRIESFKDFSELYHIDRACEHLPFNFCMREHGAKLAVASEAHSFYGTGDHHGE